MKVTHTLPWDKCPIGEQARQTTSTASRTQLGGALRYATPGCLLVVLLVVLAGFHPTIGKAASLLAVEAGKLIAPDAQEEDWLSYRPRINAAGDIVVAGAPGDDDQGLLSGSVYIFERDLGGPGNWGMRKKLIQPEVQDRECFGCCLTLDDDTLVITTDPNNDVFGGEAYIYERHRGGADNWGLVKVLTNKVSRSFASWATLDGDTLFLNALNDDEVAASAGACFIYERNLGGANNWGLLKKIVAPDGAAGDRFGFKPKLTGDTVVLGAPNRGEQGANSGAAYIFQRNQGGTNNWGFVKKLLPAQVEAGDSFGWSSGVAGDVVVVAAPWDDEVANNAGAAYVFERNEGGSNQWGMVQKITGSDITNGWQMGRVIAASERVIAVPAFGNSGDAKSGAAYLFERDEGGLSNWGQSLKIEAKREESLFGGFGVDLVNDVLAVAHIGDSEAAFQAGAILVYQLTNQVLNVVRSGSQVEVSWPEYPDYPFALQETSSLQPPAWAFAPSGRDNPVLLNPDDPSRHFRLQQVTPLEIRRQPEALRLKIGDSGSFEIDATGEGNLSYQWFFNEVAVPGANGSSLDISSAGLADEGDYTVEITDDVESLTSDTATLTIIYTPDIVQHPQGQTVQVGDTVTLTVTVTNNATLPIGYRWRRDSTTLESQVLNARTSTLTITNIQMTDAGRYSVIVTNEAFPLPGFLSERATLTVNP